MTFIGTFHSAVSVVHSNLSFMIILWFIKSGTVKAILIWLSDTLNTFLILLSLLCVFVFLWMHFFLCKNKQIQRIYFKWFSGLHQILFWCIFNCHIWNYSLQRGKELVLITYEKTILVFFTFFQIIRSLHSSACKQGSHKIA